MSAATSSRNILLAAIVALSAYVPFETVAKSSLILATFLFIIDPIPPYTRLIAIVSCLVVLKLNSWHQDFVIQPPPQEEEATIQTSTEETIYNQDAKLDEKKHQ